MRASRGRARAALVLAAGALGGCAGSAFEPWAADAAAVDVPVGTQVDTQVAPGTIAVLDAAPAGATALGRVSGWAETHIGRGLEGADAEALRRLMERAGRMGANAVGPVERRVRELGIAATVSLSSDAADAARNRQRPGAGGQVPTRQRLRVELHAPRRARREPGRLTRALYSLMARPGGSISPSLQASAER